jgi:hypothetical protein
LRVPVLSFLQLSGAARYDHFHVVDNSFGKATWNLGAELRPTSRLLLRGAMGTGFRAPDLHYVFSGNGDTHPDGIDYLTCRRENAGASYSDCDDYEVGITSHRTGNRQLKPETSRSINAGVFWQPDRSVDLSVDYFKVTLENQVLDLSKDELLRRESDCVLGETASGSAVNASSPTCLDAIARVQRYASGAFAGQLQGFTSTRSTWRASRPTGSTWRSTGAHRKSGAWVSSALRWAIPMCSTTRSASIRATR